MTNFKTAGFSVIEVVIAMGIIATLAVVTGTLLTRVSVDGREVRDQDIALRIARAEIETIRASGYDALPANGPFTNPLLNTLPSGTSYLTSTDFASTTKKVEVIVSWQGSGLTTRSVSLTTLVTQNSVLR